MKQIFFILAIILMATNTSCKGVLRKCHFDILQPYQDSCEDQSLLHCGVTYYNCSSGSSYYCTQGFAVKEVCE